MAKLQNENSKIACETYLMHYGVMGMHWGIRRFQPYPSTYKGRGKFTGKIASRRQSAIDRRVERRLARIEKKRQRAEKRNEKLEALNLKREEHRIASARKKTEKTEALKKRLMDKADVNAIKRHSELFTTEELKEIKNRVDTLASIKGEGKTKVTDIKTPSAGEAKNWVLKNLSTFADVTKSIGTIATNLKKVSETADWYEARRRARTSTSTTTSSTT